jgi:hypothetical protein
MVKDNVSLQSDDITVLFQVLKVCSLATNVSVECTLLNASVERYKKCNNVELKDVEFVVENPALLSLTVLDDRLWKVYEGLTLPSSML